MRWSLSASLKRLLLVTNYWSRTAARSSSPSRSSANHLDEAEEVFGLLEKPAKRLLGYFEVLRIACFYIGFVENVVPGREAVLFTRPCLDEPSVVILGKPRTNLRLCEGGL